MSDGHSHGPHPPQPDLEELPADPYATMAQALEELLIEQQRVSPAQIRAGLERLDDAGPMQGARLVARCWRDAAFHARVLRDVNSAAGELGLDVGSTPIRALADTPSLHNVIVCTLCSCYPGGLLGVAPDWYKARPYRSRVVREPRAVLAEFGTHIPANVELRVHDSTADLRYIVIPLQPAGTEGLDEAALAALVTRDCLIGTALPQPPAA